MRELSQDSMNEFNVVEMRVSGGIVTKDGDSYIEVTRARTMKNNVIRPATAGLEIMRSRVPFPRSRTAQVLPGQKKEHVPSHRIVRFTTIFVGPEAHHR